MADSLLRRFGSINSLLGADVASLVATPDVTQEVAHLLKAALDVAAAALAEKSRGRQVLGSFTAVHDYLKLRLQGEQVRVARLLCLDTRHGLIRDEEIARGTATELTLYPREIARAALLEHASAIIVVEGSPSATFSPSARDVANAKAIRASLSTLDIAFHDYMVLAGGKAYSYRTARLLRD
ncbi:MAG: JAB domain-containing protein [Geminicoccaceae bacterium]